MYTLYEMLAAFAYQWAFDGANMASLRGNYEMEIPKELIEENKE